MTSNTLTILIIMATLIHEGSFYFGLPKVGGIDRTKMNEINFEWISSQNDEDGWQLSTNISWPFPADTAGQKAFVVRLTQRESRCATNGSIAVLSENEKGYLMSPLFPLVMEPTDIHTEDNFTLIEGLEYGITYTVWVAVLDRVINGTSAPAYKEEKSPDCYTVTGSRSFCQPRCTPTPGAPVNLTVVSISRDEGNDGNKAEVTLSWLRPVQHNNDIKSYYVEFINSNSGQNTHVEFVNENASYSDITPFIIKQDNVDVNVTYYVKVYVFGYFYGSPRRGEFATIQTSVFPEDIETPPTNFPGTTPVFSSTTNVYPKTDSLIQTRTPVTVRGISTYFIIATVVGGAVLVLVISSTVFIFKRRRQRKKATGVFVPEIDDDDYAIPSNKEEIDLRYTTGQGVIAKQEFPRHRLSLKQELGRGHFGVVYKAIASGLAGRKDATTVAVKMLKNNATEYQKEDILREITILQELGEHPNILGILGCCTCEEPYFLITEYMEYGDLLHFLWKCRKKEYENEDIVYELTEMSYYQIARQIARGMVFLSQNKYVHGDLAARNVLVGDDLMIKITDFGLANDVYLQGWTALPTERLRAVKWVSLETNLQGMCTIESDVWSFGIVLYEIATKGGTPYPSMSPGETINAVKDGYRMEIPDGCPVEMYDLMRKCWLENPVERPTFANLLEAIDQILGKYVDYMDDGLAGEDRKYENDDVIERNLTALGNDEVQVSKKSLSKTKSQGSGDSAFSEESTLTGGSSNLNSSLQRTANSIVNSDDCVQQL